MNDNKYLWFAHDWVPMFAGFRGTLPLVTYYTVIICWGV